MYNITFIVIVVINTINTILNIHVGQTLHKNNIMCTESLRCSCHHLIAQNHNYFILIIFLSCTQEENRVLIIHWHLAADFGPYEWREREREGGERRGSEGERKRERESERERERERVRKE